MPLKGFKDSKKRITFLDCKLHLDDEPIKGKVIYPSQILKAFSNYLEKLYGVPLVAERWEKKNEGSEISLFFYVPATYATDNEINSKVQSDVQKFENRFSNYVKIVVDPIQGIKLQYNKIDKDYQKLISLQATNRRNNPNKPTQLERAKELFRIKNKKEFDENNPEDLKKLEFLANWESLKNQPEALQIASRLFRLNWGSDPNLEDEDDQEELLLLYNMNQDELQTYYTVNATMYFNSSEFSRKRQYEGRTQINLFNKYLPDSKKIMKKDEDPRLELVEKIKLKCPSDSRDVHYNLNDEIITYGDYEFRSWSRDEMIDWVVNESGIEHLDHTPYIFEELNKLNNQQLVDTIRKEMDRDEYAQQVNSMIDLNTIDGLKTILNGIADIDWDDEDDDFIEDVKQKQICDSFSKRYKK